MSQAKPIEQYNSRRDDCLRQLRRDTKSFFESSFLNYSVKHAEQKRIVNRLINCANNIGDFVDQQIGLVLYGKIGTGKDHLACTLLRYAAQNGYKARWVQGTDLYEMSSRSWKNGTRPLRQYIAADCLLISDPVFARNWSEAKAETLAKVVRGRYDAGKATWITNNANELGWLQKMCVPDVFDRLTERAVVEYCNWTSVRQEKQIQY